MTTTVYTKLIMASEQNLIISIWVELSNFSNISITSLVRTRLIRTTDYITSLTGPLVFVLTRLFTIDSVKQIYSLLIY